MKTVRGPCLRNTVASLILGSILALPAVADSSAFDAQLKAIAAHSETSNAGALRELDALQATLPSSISYGHKRDLLKLRVRLLLHAGRLREAYAADRELLRLADAAGDRDTAALARMGAVTEQLDQNNPRAALAELLRIQSTLDNKTGVETRIHLNLTFGQAYTALGKFETALSHHLHALQLAEEHPGGRQHELNARTSIGRLYITMKNPGKALETLDAAIDTLPPDDSSRAAASLQFARGIALVARKRNTEGLHAFERALDISSRSGFTALEATIRGNIADHYLRMHDYANAEKAARAALHTSQQVNDVNALMMAQANLGFALGGQGKVNEALPYLDNVIAALRNAGATADLEAMLDEKSRMYEKAGLFKQALATVREQQALQSQIFEADRERAVATLQEQFDAKARTKQIELLGRENALKDAELRNRRFQQIVTLLGAALTILAGIFIFSLYRKVKKTNGRLRDLNTQLEFHAMRDPLTGLFNRRSFVEKMKSRSAAPAADRRSPAGENVACIALIDIDHFKNINDTWGHAVGDSVLVEIAQRLGQSVRDSDMVLRWGGEEFLIYSPETSPALLGVMVDRTLRAVGSTPVQVGDLSVPVTLSCGFVPLPFSGIPESECNWEKALQLADDALYLAKVRGRNRAYGIARLLAPPVEAMPAIEADLGAAATAGMVELIEVVGPVRQ